ncbi:MAG: FecR domain-containing protein [Deltaproteobacteria bacterium]|nr:FecR domain-containing protein [Deltaproteobacteria bacterium]MBT4266964.1 FecR domain-containing protein [Deltaproteobacteria bacterium]MBT4639685.1 FecR domain-containing protein [Deltaproteobacteria bacterium]MBT6504890.1 FecR domain-containing protein [Deltaproteobacteria bacterium]MBT7150995.1 FecR domain-containing protein [Deltaproteobacteria bacterium]
MLKNAFLSAVISLTLILTLWVPNSFAINAVASIKDLRGQIEIERGSARLAGRTGLILYDQDMVVTGKTGKVTIAFRDGSLLRLFTNTRFLLEKSVESKKGSRRFLHHLFLEIGSFWGKFTKKYQSTTIRTPTATAGIKGTVVSMVERDDKLTVSLSSGAVTVKNDDDAVDLQPGQILSGITRRGSISDKIKNLPFHLVIKADKTEIKVPETREEVGVYLTLQMVQKNSNQNAFRAGPIYISHVFDNIRFGTDIHLNERGYARIKAIVKPFKGENSVRKTIDITVIMDGEEFLDVDAGHTRLIFVQTGKKAKTLKIDVNSDKIN